MSKTIEEIQKEIVALRNAIDELEDKKYLPKVQALIGRYFKYPNNCYSCPETEKDYWPVYKKMVKANGRSVEYIGFQTDSNGKHEIERGTLWNGNTSGLVEITKGEYDRAFKKFHASIAELGMAS